MALKDWKKIGANRWKRKSKNLTFDESMYAIVRIRIAHVPNLFSRKRWNKEYQVSLLNEKGTIENRAEYFKTKSAALKFAKSYMRSH